MRVLVMGAGGVGGYFGGLLARQGHEVAFVARGAHLEALRQRGLTIVDRGERWSLPQTRAVSSPAEAGGDFDLILFTVKTYDNATACPAIRPAVGPRTAVLPLQNGVDSVDELSAAVGGEHVLGGATQVGARIAEAGVVERFSPFCQVVLGEPSGGVSERAERIAAALREVDVDATASPDIQVALWEKLMMLAPLASLTSAANVTSGQIRAVPETATLWHRMMSEVAAVGQAQDVAITDATMQTCERVFAGLPDSHTTSMQRDFESRRKVELEYLTGAVVRRGRVVGVATPCFDVVYAILKARALSFGGI